MAYEQLCGAAAVAALAELYTLCRAAEQARAEEAGAAVVLQACWRGCLQRAQLRKLSHVALTIQRCWRGYLGRRRFAAARSAHDKQLREAYFHDQATVIQKCWRGYFSRTRVHDYYKRKAYLAAVAAASAAVRASTTDALQEALAHQHQEREAAARQQFEMQVSRLHHLLSTACTAGVLNAPTAAAMGALPGVGGVTLEEHLRAASKQQAAGTVRQQQAAVRHELAASPTCRRAPGSMSTAVAGASCCCSSSSSSSSKHGVLRLPSAVPAAGDAATHQSNDAANFERRVTKAMVAALHGGRPFVLPSPIKTQEFLRSGG